MKRLLLIAALVAGTAHAEFWDGNTLYSRITSTSYYEQGSAMGYIMGVADTTISVLHCAPPTATAGQLQDMVLLYMRTYPERRTRMADSIVVDTLKTAWPCPERRSNGGRSL